MYQYGNVAVKYQDPHRRKAKAYIDTAPPGKHGNPKPAPRTMDEKRARQSRTEALPASKPRASRITALEKSIYILSVLTIIAVLTVLMTQQATIAQNNYELETYQNEIEHIEKLNANLETEVTALSAPERIIEIATSELGMQAEGAKVKILSERSR